MTITHQVNKLHRRYKKYGEQIKVDHSSYLRYIKGLSDTMLFRLENGDYVESKCPIPRESLLKREYKGYILVARVAPSTEYFTK